MVQNHSLHDKARAGDQPLLLHRRRTGGDQRVGNPPGPSRQCRVQFSDADLEKAVEDWAWRDDHARD
jgi:hypothetical protein